MSEKNYGHGIWGKIFSSRDWGKYPPEAVIRNYHFAFKKNIIVFYHL